MPMHGSIHPLQAEALACIAPLVCFAGQAKPWTLAFTTWRSTPRWASSVATDGFFFPTNNPRVGALILGRSEYMLPVSLACVFENHVVLYFFTQHLPISFSRLLCFEFLYSKHVHTFYGLTSALYNQWCTVVYFVLFFFSFVHSVHSPACSDSLILVTPLQPQSSPCSCTAHVRYIPCCACIPMFKSSNNKCGNLIITQLMNEAIYGSQRADALYVGLNEEMLRHPTTKSMHGEW
jgi:hypothetical protein